MKLSFLIGIFFFANTSFSQSSMNLAEKIESSHQFSVLESLLESTDLLDALDNNSSLTLFAPNDNAFSKLPCGAVSALSAKKNKKLLKQILLYHVAKGTLNPTKDGKDRFSTFQGSFKKSSLIDSSLKIFYSSGSTLSVNRIPVDSEMKLAHGEQSMAEIRRVLIPRKLKSTVFKASNAACKANKH